MYLFYSKEIKNEQLRLDGDEHQHCSKVLRKKTGDAIFVTDGNGNFYSAIIASSSRNETFCIIRDVQHFEKPLPEISIAVAPTKNTARMEWFVEKAVEIGISNILFFNAGHSERKHFNMERIGKIALSAMKQSGQVYMPEIEFCENFGLVIDKSKNKDQKFIAHCETGELLLTRQIKPKLSTVVLIGPEGDFTKEEVQLALESGFQETGLGPTRLRTETAALTALILVRFGNL